MQDIDIYYESIKQVYNQIHDRIASSLERKQPLQEKLADWFVGASSILFLASLIPILPLGIIFLGSQFDWVFGPLSFKQVSLGQIVAVWISLAIPTLIIFASALWINDKVDSRNEKLKEPTQTLSPEQLTFIAVYEAYKELKIYFVSHVDKHIENSRLALSRIFPLDRWGFTFEQMQRLQYLEPADAEMVYMVERSRAKSGLERTSLSKQISIAHEFLKTFEQYTWLQLEQSTKLILQALISFPDKVYSRLAKREDLPSVLSVLENLSKFSYAYLPEHKTYMDPAALERLQNAGGQCLKSFVQEVNSMTHYSEPTEQKQTKTEASLSWLDKIRKSDYANILFQFVIWFVLLLILTSGGVYVLAQWFTLSPDTIVSLIVGTSVAGAIALTGILLRSSKT